MQAQTFIDYFSNNPKNAKKYFDFVSQPFEIVMITDFFVGFEKRENRLCYDFKESNDGENYFTHHFISFFGINQQEDVRPLTTMLVWSNYDKLSHTNFWKDYPLTLNDFIDNIIKTNYNVNQLKEEKIFKKEKLYKIPLIFTDLAISKFLN